MCIILFLFYHDVEICAYVSVWQATSCTVAEGASMDTVELFVKKDYFKFNAAHFVINAAGRERLHGHNYTAAVS